MSYIDELCGQIFIWPFLFKASLSPFVSNFLVCSGGAKDQKILFETKGDRDDNQTSLKNIIKVASSDLEAFQSVITKSGHSLDEICEYDDGRIYQCWSNNAGNSVIIDVGNTPADNSDRIINEIIDCWLELRAIRNALEIEEDSVGIKKKENVTAFEQLMAKIHEYEAEIHGNDAFYQLLKRGEVDAAVLSFYNLDDEIRQAVLQ